MGLGLVKGLGFRVEFLHFGLSDSGFATLGVTSIKSFVGSMCEAGAGGLGFGVWV